MLGLRRARRAIEAFNRYADNTRELPPHQPLDSGASGFGLVYEVNPVYLEAGQGGNSYLRGVGVLVILFGFSAVWYYIPPAMYSMALDLGRSTSFLFFLFFMISGAFCLILATLVTVAWVGPAFLAPVDIFTRYDRKRQKVWVWNYQGPVELDWNRLVPVIRSTVSSPYLPNRLYHGVYVEFGAGGHPKKTGNTLHVVRVGPAMSASAGVLPAMEYVRRYMEEGLQALPPVNRFLQRKRPAWWMILNLGGLMENWRDHFAGEKLALGLPYGMTILYILMFPLYFPMFATNWLALRVAPCPKWPREWLRMHQRDLAELAAHSPASPAHVWRKPVIRVNGRIIDVDPNSKAPAGAGAVKNDAPSRWCGPILCLLATAAITLALVGSIGPWALLWAIGWAGVPPHALPLTFVLGWSGGGLAMLLTLLAVWLTTPRQSA